MQRCTAESSSDIVQVSVVRETPNSLQARNFHHPYTPYDIQNDFMNTIYEVLEHGEGSVGILESPTGTGKSLSLICGALTWLREHKRKDYEQLVSEQDTASDEPEWITAQARARKRKELFGRREEMEARLMREREKEKLKTTKQTGRDLNAKRRKIGIADEKVSDEEEFVLEDYESDTENKKQPRAPRNVDGLSSETVALMAKAGMITSHNGTSADDIVEEGVKIFYCSRTHSQLTQFAHELRRVKMPSSLPPLVSDDKIHSDMEEGFKYLALGSRKNLCINSEVTRLQNVAAMNERCKELQENKTAVEKKCCFVPKMENQHLVAAFRDRTLATVRDIEDLGALGKVMGICPYYAARDVIRSSEIVTLPYPSLLQKNTREALGIDLRGHVVIIDEAHNLLDAISAIYGVDIGLSQLRISRKGLGMYLHKFKNRLTGKNRVYVAQVLRLVDSLILYLGHQSLSAQEDGVVIDSELLGGKGVDQIDLHKLLRYLQESKLVRKVEGYILHAEKQEQSEKMPNCNPSENSMQGTRTMSSVTTPTLQAVVSLLTALTNPSQEGKLFYSRAASQVSQLEGDVRLRYILLDPTHHFREIVDSARATILAGGTMSPMADYTHHLLSYMPPHKITTLSCGHVIPQSNLLAWTLSSGPTDQKFEFTFGRRAGKDGESMIDELGKTILNICAIVPDGIVVFFPSYKHLDDVIRRWQLQLSASENPIWERLSRRKNVFRESKGTTNGEDVLASYSHSISQGDGGLLLSVVGGKMSEGINFSDKLGRCVVIVGLPFPNIMSGEWKAKMAYIERMTEERLTKDGALTKAELKHMSSAAAREFYENACMRAVNQSVGRAIRHKGDYAVIIMIDTRFGQDRIKMKLPRWIQNGLVESSEAKPFGQLMGNLGRFFREKKVVI